MSISRRLTLLLAIPLSAICGLYFLGTTRFSRIETQSRIMGLQVGSITALGSVLRCFAEMRLSVRSYLMAGEPAEQARAEAAFRQNQAELNRLLARYGDKLISSDEDRRLLYAFQDLSGRWRAEIEKILAQVAAGRREDAIAATTAGPAADLGSRATKVLGQWIEHNEHLAARAGETTLSAIDDSRRNLLATFALVMALSGILGLVTFRRIVHPIRGLQESVEVIAEGDYAHPVPFTKLTDETGGLARSIDVLRHGAAALEEQRWVKANVAKLTGALQRAASHVRVRRAAAHRVSCRYWAAAWRRSI